MHKVALVVGHKKNSPGACNDTYGVCEFEFNNKLVKMVYDFIIKFCTAEIVYRDTYKTLPEKINKLNPDFTVCFHANAFNKKVFGASTLYYHKSEKGKKIAEIFQSNIIKTLNLHDRGIKPKSSEDKGGYVLRYTKAPCIILEPFFIDNDEDYTYINNNLLTLAIVCSNSVYEVTKRLDI